MTHTKGVETYLEWFISRDGWALDTLGGCRGTSWRDMGYPPTGGEVARGLGAEQQWKIPPSLLQG